MSVVRIMVYILRLIESSDNNGRYQKSQGFIVDKPQSVEQNR